MWPAYIHGSVQVSLLQQGKEGVACLYSRVSSSLTPTAGKGGCGLLIFKGQFKSHSYSRERRVWPAYIQGSVQVSLQQQGKEGVACLYSRASSSLTLTAGKGGCGLLIFKGQLKSHSYSRERRVWPAYIQGPVQVPLLQQGKEGVACLYSRVSSSPTLTAGKGGCGLLIFKGQFMQSHSYSRERRVWPAYIQRPVHGVSLLQQGKEGVACLYSRASSWSLTLTAGKGGYGLLIFKGQFMESHSYSRERRVWPAYIQGPVHGVSLLQQGREGVACLYSRVSSSLTLTAGKGGCGLLIFKGQFMESHSYSREGRVWPAYIQGPVHGVSLLQQGREGVACLYSRVSSSLTLTAGKGGCGLLIFKGQFKSHSYSRERRVWPAYIQGPVHGSLTLTAGKGGCGLLIFKGQFKSHSYSRERRVWPAYIQGSVHGVSLLQQGKEGVACLYSRASSSLTPTAGKGGCGLLIFKGQFKSHSYSRERRVWPAYIQGPVQVSLLQQGKEGVACLYSRVSSCSLTLTAGKGGCGLLIFKGQFKSHSYSRERRVWPAYIQGSVQVSLLQQGREGVACLYSKASSSLTLTAGKGGCGLLIFKGQFKSHSYSRERRVWPAYIQGSVQVSLFQQGKEGVACLYSSVSSSLTLTAGKGGCGLLTFKGQFMQSHSSSRERRVWPAYIQGSVQVSLLQQGKEGVACLYSRVSSSLTLTAGKGGCGLLIFKGQFMQSHSSSRERRVWPAYIQGSVQVPLLQQGREGVACLYSRVSSCRLTLTAGKGGYGLLIFKGQFKSHSYSRERRVWPAYIQGPVHVVSLFQQGKEGVACLYSRVSSSPTLTAGKGGCGLLIFKGQFMQSHSYSRERRVWPAYIQGSVQVSLLQQGKEGVACLYSKASSWSLTLPAGKGGCGLLIFKGQFMESHSSSRERRVWPAYIQGPVQVSLLQQGKEGVACLYSKASSWSLTLPAGKGGCGLLIFKGQFMESHSSSREGRVWPAYIQGPVHGVSLFQQGKEGVACLYSKASSWSLTLPAGKGGCGLLIFKGQFMESHSSSREGRVWPAYIQGPVHGVSLFQQGREGVFRQ